MTTKRFLASVHDMGQNLQSLHLVILTTRARILKFFYKNQEEIVAGGSYLCVSKYIIQKEGVCLIADGDVTCMNPCQFVELHI